MKENKISKHIEARPEMIYAALTTPIGIHSWFSKKGAIGSKIGDTHELDYIMKGEPRFMSLEVHDLIHNEFVAWQVKEHEHKAYIDSIISFSIGPKGELEFVQSNFDEDYLTDELQAHNLNVWNYLVSNLKDFCEGREAHPW